MLVWSNIQTTPALRHVRDVLQPVVVSAFRHRERQAAVLDEASSIRLNVGQ
jgi:hypothetical protein